MNVHYILFFFFLEHFIIIISLNSHNGFPSGCCAHCTEEDTEAPQGQQHNTCQRSHVSQDSDAGPTGTKKELNRRSKQDILSPHSEEPYSPEPSCPAELMITALPSPAQNPTKAHVGPHVLHLHTRPPFLPSRSLLPPPIS